jgi:hypothetical protein
MSALRDVLAGRAAALGADSRDVAGGMEFTRGGAIFATLAGGTVSVHLDPAIAQAALRTPDTAPSPLGPDWVAFSPGELDGRAIDRASAWFDAAWRRAG